MYYKSTLFALLFLLFSCTKVQDKEYAPKPLINQTEVVPKKVIFSKIDVQNIKTQLSAVTTTFLNKEEAEIYIDKGNSKYYGLYNLFVKKANKTHLAGTLVVYDTINPAIYDKKTDEFIEVFLVSGGISIFDNRVHVGMSKDALVAVLAEPTREENNVLIYNNEFQTGFFKIENDKVSRLKIGLYRDATSVQQALLAFENDTNPMLVSTKK